MIENKIYEVIDYIKRNLKDRDVMEISRKLDLSRPTITKLKNGNFKNVTVGTLFKMCDYIRKNYENND